MNATFALEVLHGPLKGRTFSLSRRETVLGRGPAADIDLEDREASRRHCLVVFSKGAVSLTDQGSANGVFVNERQVEAADVQPGDVIRIGNTELRLTAAEQPRDDRSDQDLPEHDRSWTQALSLDRITAMGWSVKALCLMLAAAVLGHALATRPLLSAQHAMVSEQALKRAQVLVLTLAALNQEALRLGDEMLLETESVAVHDGVLEVFIYDIQGRILAPLSRFHEAPTDLATSRALTAETLHMAERGRGVYDLAEPIRAYNPQTGSFDRIGTARVVFSVKNVADMLEAGGQRRAWISLIVMLLAAALLARAFVHLASWPIMVLRDDMEAVLKGDRSSLEPTYRMAALDTLMASINRCLIKVGSDTSRGPHRDPGAETAELRGQAQDDADGLSRLLVESVKDGILVVDSRNEILLANPVLAGFMGLDHGQLTGKHFFEAFPDQKLLSAVVKLVQEALSASGQQASASVIAGGAEYEVQATVRKQPDQSHGDYRFLIIALRPLKHEGEQDRVHS